MTDDSKRYYETYHSKYKDDAYTMAKAGHHSRVLVLKEYLEKCTPFGGTVADIGCSDLYMATICPQFRWIGLDIAPAPTAPKEVIKHDLEVTPYPLGTGSIDTVICTEVLEHLFTPYTVHREAHRILKPGGHFIVSTPNVDHIDHFVSHFRPLVYNPDFKHSVEHIRWYDFNVHADLMNKNGFKILERTGADAHYTNMFHDLRIVLKKEMPNKSDSEIDKIIGKGFAELSHTICILGRKE